VSTHPADRRPAGRPAAVVDPATGKKFDEKRPRDTRIGQGNKAEPKRRLTAEESFELPKPWIHEITELARPGTAPKVAELISKALEQFAEEEYEESARLAAEAKASATRSPRITELLGLALYHSGKWKEALSELLTFRRLTASLEHNHVIADLYRAVGRPDRALETTAEVSQADVTPETWVETMIVAAGALADKGDLNRAITMLARADPGTGPVETYFLRHWYARADLLERAGRREEARNLWRKIVAEDPDFFDAEERLASV
jgi:tetratricopeptide (TPR) repeat protein